MQNTTVTDAAAEHIRRLRLERGWSAQRLADECKLAGFPALTRGTIAKIESGARKHLNADELAVLAHVLGVNVDNLLDSAAAAERFIREQFTNIVVEAGLADELRKFLPAGVPGLPAKLPSAPSSQAALAEIVDLCSGVTGGLRALTDLVALLRPDSDEASRLRELAEQLTPRAGDIDLLRHIVGDVVVPDLADLASEAAGGPLEWSGEGVVDTYLELFELSGDERPLLPLIFLELVANRSPATRDQLREWNDQRADRLNLRRELARFRHTRFPSPAAREALTLMICISESQDDETEYLLASWRQREPHEWPPPRGPILRATHADLEAAVDEIVIEAETAWADHAEEIQLEFVLPRRLLGLPVDTWRTELASGAPVPLALRYPVSVRSLERMRTRPWHRAWRRRANHLPHSTTDNLYRPRPEDADTFRLDAVLSDEHWTAVALNGPPTPHPAARSDELIAALRTGLPVVVWHRGAGTAETAAEAVRDLIGDAPLNQLPQRIAEARRDAFRDPKNESMRNLVVLWDDPSRLISTTDLDLTDTEAEH
ncbi:helix-turn-helix transcriptional regulator [Amycolatopsis sp. H6(2020)]|nr:helix-turn-helix transcriptional regulator [Amycolatopsis sp. H6(2020)]